MILMMMMMMTKRLVADVIVTKIKKVGADTMKASWVEPGILKSFQGASNSGTQ